MPSGRASRARCRRRSYSKKPQPQPWSQHRADAAKRGAGRQGPRCEIHTRCPASRSRRPSPRAPRRTSTPTTPRRTHLRPSARARRRHCRRAAVGKRSAPAPRSCRPWTSPEAWRSSTRTVVPAPPPPMSQAPRARTAALSAACRRSRLPRPHPMPQPPAQTESGRPRRRRQQPCRPQRLPQGAAQWCARHLGVRWCARRRGAASSGS
mmetsp:Transcript_90454/g.258799  ORF Transcript_90454/g.258799 Transcript_90454/m.258799 type:complete len:208 (+) Transcript_90454:160-783(+)